ncbi:fumarylacetoacetate hydrolase family protein [Nocardia sp. CDC160]|uniref:fumarylacetoacetate hydrolase family protein n=1 Tax=Nocardia sp. CDC160 TaxID=3112166 RepID=UPI002DBAAC48|nr:fumarylacetoacetate hydrolase family protein [Nocardia sp. CDC160]MEC3916322.1 fumarylacetoacetate hydrolase family protein [Nocardia sp. CDC160]
MKLLRVGAKGSEKPAAIDDSGVIRDLSAFVADIDGQLLGDPSTLATVQRALASGGLPEVDSAQRIGAPIARPGKVIGVGLNYTDHAAAIGAAIPERPVVFLKPGTTISGPYDAIEIPRGSQATDHEVELGVVIGQRLRDCPDPATALGAVGGYVTANDVTERNGIAGEPTWVKGKSYDTFTPIGPWLVTPDEVAEPQSLSLQLWVNGERRQEGTTGNMVAGVGELLAYLSSLMTLEPGDLVLTGTPAGVAVSRPEPKPYLRDGDVVVAEVAGLGRQQTLATGMRG